MRMFADEIVLRDALDTWGYDAQIGMVHEELGELITAINQWRRKRIPKEKLISEVADAFIMIMQMSVILGEDGVQEQVNYKMARLGQRLKDYNAVPSDGIRKE